MNSQWTRIGLVATLSLFTLTACSNQEPAPTDASTAETNDDHDHDDDHAHDDTHMDDEQDHGHGHGDPVELGTAAIGDYTIRVARDEGEIAPGGDAPIDVYVTDGDLASLLAVRFWVGSEDAVGSIKARGEIEHADQPNHFHNHVMIPDPLPDSSQLWIELDVDGVGKTAAPFDLQSD